MGRNPLATVTVAGRQVTTDGPLDLDAATGGRVTGDGGVLAALEALLEAFRSPDIADLPPSTPDWSATWATTWCARWSTSPTSPRTTSAIPTPSCR